MSKSGLINLFLLAFLLTASQCKDEAASPEGGKVESCLPDALPEWVGELAEDTSENRQIIQYNYKGQVVFAVSLCEGCADGMMVVYDCDQNTLCQFGGIAGFNTCPDFEQKAIFTRVILDT